LATPVYLSFNGAIIPEEDFRISANNRGLRYGDGLFETMKIRGGQILLEQLHTDRLFASLRLMQIQLPESFSVTHLREQIKLLLKKNEHIECARVRVMVCRGDGGLYEATMHQPLVLIQSWPLQESVGMSSVKIDVYPDGRKSMDAFSNLKSNNYLCYVMGAIFAAKKQLDDALILNAQGRIADATIANVFLIKDGKVITPPLSEGCVNGVYRRFLLERFIRDGTLFRERPVGVDALLSADEVFLTNAITGIRSVASCGTKRYANEMTQMLQQRYLPAAK
jgi:branched-chain amino acid aminotransferase